MFGYSYYRVVWVVCCLLWRCSLGCLLCVGCLVWVVYRLLLLMFCWILLVVLIVWVWLIAGCFIVYWLFWWL